MFSVLMEAGGDKATGRAGKPATAPSADKARGKDAGTGAHAQRMAESEAKKASDAKSKETNKLLASLQAEVKILRAAGVAPTPAVVGDSGMDVDHVGAEAGASALEAAISAARGELSEMQAFSDFHKSFIPDYEGKLTQAKDKLEAALVARRNANPLKKQLEGAEGHQQRCTRKVAGAKELLEERRKQLAEAQAAMQRQEAALSEAEAVLAKADAQVADLAARFASERSAAPPAAAVHVHSHCGSPPEGFVSLAYAQEQWLAREAAVAAQIEELQRLVAGTEASAPLEAAPSEVGDPLEDLEDDVAWGKIDKSKRKIVVNRQRDRLAKEVRTSLSKVSGGSSPFAKR
jgi:chromosome segregation ATPase